MGIAGLQASWLEIWWTTISSWPPHLHLPYPECATKQSSNPAPAYPQKYQPQLTDQMPHHADFLPGDSILFGIKDVNLFHGKALEIDRVQSAFHNKCRLQMRVDIFG